MALRFYNTLKREKEIFKPLKEGKVSLYTCGPTVYNYVHIGNLRTFLFEDVLVRYLRYKGYEVTQIMNITDVDDKTIKGSKESGLSIFDYTKRYKEAFHEDLKTLEISPASVYPCATEHIEEMVELIEGLMEKGLAYRAEDGSIYFGIDRYEGYGKLSWLSDRTRKEGASGRITEDEYDKDSAHDFVLWKGYSEEDGDIFWETRIGKGRPGWHTECSAMSMKYLGKHFDIHTGGVDNIFPHHENELAQSVGCTGEEFVNYWLHSEFLNIKGEKSSKSLGNVLYLRDLLSKGYSKESIRLSLISSHYRSKINYSEELIKQASSNISTINQFIESCYQIEGEKPYNKELDKVLKDKISKFEGALDDDLNMPVGLASIFELIREVNPIMSTLGAGDSERLISFLEDVNSIFAVFRFDRGGLEDKIEKLIKERDESRAKKDYAHADAIRKELYNMGIIIKDNPSGAVWHRIAKS